MVLMVTVFALAAVILIFVLKRKNAQNSDQPAPAAVVKNPDGTISAESASSIVERIRVDLDKLAKTSATSDAEIARLRNEKGNAEAAASYNVTKVADLQAEVAGLKQEVANGQVAAARIQQLEQQLADITKEKLDLQVKAASGSSPQALEDLRLQLKGANDREGYYKEELANARAELEKLRNQLAEGGGDKVKQLEDDLKKLHGEKVEMQLMMQDLRSLYDRARLYVKSEKDLDPQAQKLFARLRKLNMVPSDKLKPAYDLLGADLNARIVKQVGFDAGSSRINLIKEADIKDALATAQPDSFFLVVGYASMTGDAKQNEVLSANRASTTASVVNILKADGQDVKAVYLGQTKRFSADQPALNQVCEIWEIKKKP